MNARRRLIKKSVMNVLKNEYFKLQRIELYETCFKGGELEQQGLLSGAPSESEFDRCHETIEREFNILFFLLNLSELNEELREDLISIHKDIDLWPVEDILEVINKI